MSALDRNSTVATSASLWTWNINMRIARLEEQIAHVLSAAPDILCLQEVNPNALPLWTTRLRDARYNVEASAPRADAAGGRRLGVLIASRSGLTRVEQPTGLPWTERLLVADVQLPGWTQALRVMCLHAPTRGNPGLAKVLTFEAVSASLAALPDQLPAVLCGDLNVPQHEAPDGTITTFGQTPRGYLHRDGGAREDVAERTILHRPLLGDEVLAADATTLGWSDAFRALRGYEFCDWSWKAGRGTKPGYRLDHILLSPHLKSVECDYDHDVRNDGLSDHSAMYATVELSMPAVASLS